MATFKVGDFLPGSDLNSTVAMIKSESNEDVHVNTVVDGTAVTVQDFAEVSASSQRLIIYSGNSGDRNVLLAPAESGTDEKVELIQIAPIQIGEMAGDGKVWHIIPNTVNLSTESVVIVGNQAAATPRINSAGDTGSQLGLVNTTLSKSAPPDAPQWASIINDCEKVGHYYRGWVATEQDLDIVLTLHKQQTNSFWGTRQSPDGKRPSARMMWKSQYVPFDGIPFINCGSRATVMECQFGPRRRGNKTDVKDSVGNGNVYVDFKHSCPARIYVKKVRKFPEYAIPVNLKKRELKHVMDNSFNALKRSGFHDHGEDRFYMQLPTVNAHEYHGYDDISSTHVTKTYDVSGHTYNASTGTRLAEPVAMKIRDIVASGISHITTVRKMLRKYVEKELFNNEEPPVRHDLSFFPTVSDLKNHVHTALVDIEHGTLPLREASIDTLALEQDQDWPSNWASNLVPQPETVTVTLTQTDEANGHMISRVETHMSDGSTQISTNLTADTAALLARLHPNMFPTLGDSGEVDGEKLTELVQSVLLKTTTDENSTAIGDSHHVETSLLDTHNHAAEPPPEPAPPTEGVQLDLGLPDTAHEVAEVTLDGDVPHESCPVELTV